MKGVSDALDRVITVCSFGKQLAQSLPLQPSYVHSKYVPCLPRRTSVANRPELLRAVIASCHADYGCSRALPLTDGPVWLRPQPPRLGGKDIVGGGRQRVDALLFARRAGGSYVLQQRKGLCEWMDPEKYVYFATRAACEGCSLVQVAPAKLVEQHDTVDYPHRVLQDSLFAESAEQAALRALGEGEKTDNPDKRAKFTVMRLVDPARDYGISLQDVLAHPAAATAFSILFLQEAQRLLAISAIRKRMVDIVLMPVLSALPLPASAAELLAASGLHHFSPVLRCSVMSILAPMGAAERCLLFFGARCFILPLDERTFLLRVLPIMKEVAQEKVGNPCASPLPSNVFRKPLSVAALVRLLRRGALRADVTEECALFYIPQVCGYLRHFPAHCAVSDCGTVAYV